MKIGLLGASKIAVEAIINPSQVIPGIELTAVGARDMDRAQAYAKEHRISNAFNSYEHVIEFPDTQLIYIALPISHHAHWAVKALVAGKHVLCEKPFAMNAQEAKHVCDVAKANDRRVIEAFHYSHHPVFRTFMDWLRSGKIGKIRSIEAQFSAPIIDDGDDIRFRPKLGGGTMMDLGCYPLHWIRTIMGGNPISIAAEAVLTESGVDEKITAQLSYPDNVNASLMTQFGADAPLAAFLKVHGDDGEIQFFNPLAPQMGTELKLVASGKTEIAPVSPLGTYTYQLADVVKALNYKLPLENEGEATIKHQTAMDEVYRAADLAQLRETTINI